MKKALLLFGIALALRVEAGTVTLNEITPDGFSYSVEWGPQLDGSFNSFRLPSGMGISAIEYPWIQGGVLDTVEASGVLFRFANAPGDVSFSGATITVDTFVRPLPSSIVSTADGFGAVIRYGSAPAAIPDSGPGAAAVVGLLGILVAGRRRNALDCR